MSHTILAHLKQHLHNKNGRPNREHRCGAGQIPSEGQVRTSQTSRVLERGKLCVPWFVRVLRLLQQQMVDLSSLDQKSFPYRSLLGYALMTPYSAPIRSPFVDTYQWKLMLLPVTVNLCLSMSQHYFYPYQMPPTSYPHRFKLTGYGLANYLLVQGSGKIIYG